MGSMRFQLDQQDWQKIIKGFFIGLAGAGVVWLTQMESADFGYWNFIIIPVVAAGCNALRKWLVDNSK